MGDWGDCGEIAGRWRGDGVEMAWREVAYRVERSSQRPNRLHEPTSAWLQHVPQRRLPGGLRPLP